MNTTPIYIFIEDIMKVLVFDTETTGLPKSRNSSIYSSDEWPYIIQMGWIIYDTDTKEINTFSHIVKCPIDPSPESVAIHHITKEQIEDEGIDITYVIELFRQCVDNSDVVVAHNISFDKRMIMVECIRNQFPPIFANVREYCTMKDGKSIANILKTSPSGRQYFKFPKLTELHEALFKTVPSGIHDALVDTMICLRCYMFMTNKSDIFELSKPFATIYEKYIQVDVC